jgi:hypothetical protein
MSRPARALMSDIQWSNSPVLLEIIVRASTMRASKTAHTGHNPEAYVS